MIPRLFAAFFQVFSPEMPAGVPGIPGPASELAVLRFIEVKEGAGARAQPGQEYAVHYTGWLRNGTKFDSSVARDDPFKFIQGRRQVISGWDTGFEGMREGGRRRLFIPYQLAYGEKGRGSIPPRAELVFDVELLAVRDVEPEQPARELLVQLADMEKKLVALARAMPEDKYGWKPSPRVRPFGEVIAHISLGNALMAGLAEKTPEPADLKARVEEQRRSELHPRSKAELVAMLEASFAELRKKLEPLRSGQLSREIKLWGQDNTVRGAYIGIVGHVGEHLGQLISYARMQGVRPPWSPE